MAAFLCPGSPVNTSRRQEVRESRDRLAVLLANHVESLSVFAPVGLWTVGTLDFNFRQFSDKLSPAAEYINERAPVVVENSFSDYATIHCN